MLLPTPPVLDPSAFVVLGVFCGLLLIMIFMAKPISCVVKTVRMRMKGGKVRPLNTTQSVQHSWEEVAPGYAPGERVLAGQV